MTDKEFENLKLEIEKKMVELDKLQSIHRQETGQDHRMPMYLRTPKHLENL
jgi:hypothetical protein